MGLQPRLVGVVLADMFLEALQREVAYEVENGERITYWDDGWLEENPLMLVFLSLYAFSTNKSTQFCVLILCYYEMRMGGIVRTWGYS